jgi:transposase
LTYEVIAELLGVGRATVSRVLRRHREAGTVQPRPRGGGNRSPIRGKAAEKLSALLANRPDLTVAEMAAELTRLTKIQTSRSSVHRALTRLGYTRKKRASLPSNATRPRT